VICKGALVAMAAGGPVIHRRELLWVLQVVGSNPAAPTNKTKYLAEKIDGQSSQKFGLGRVGFNMSCGYDRLPSFRNA
jgi:hypothetical protein